MTDIEVVPYLNKSVEVELVDGRLLRGRFCSFEAQITGTGKYAVAYRTGPDPIVHGETYAGIHSAEQIVAIRDLPENG